MGVTQQALALQMYQSSLRKRGAVLILFLLASRMEQDPFAWVWGKIVGFFIIYYYSFIANQPKYTLLANSETTAQTKYCYDYY